MIRHFKSHENNGERIRKIKQKGRFEYEGTTREYCLQQYKVNIVTFKQLRTVKGILGIEFLHVTKIYKIYKSLVYNEMEVLQRFLKLVQCRYKTVRVVLCWIIK